MNRNVPAAWRAVPELTGALALFLAANSFVHAADKKGSQSNFVAIVAPLFEHGEGRGATGCVVVTPPAFLSEEDALQVIREELAKTGLRLSQQGPPIKGVQAPIAEYYKDKDDRTTLRLCARGERTEPFGRGERAGPFKADLADRGKNVVVEFLSWEDFDRLCGHTTRLWNGSFMWSSVRGYDFKNLARLEAEQVKNQGQEKTRFAVFYDPCARSEISQAPAPKDTEARRKWADRVEAMSQAESKRLLRLQVQDFVKWLQGQGVI